MEVHPKPPWMCYTLCISQWVETPGKKVPRVRKTERVRFKRRQHQIQCLTKRTKHEVALSEPFLILSLPKSLLNYDEMLGFCSTVSTTRSIYSVRFMLQIVSF